MFSAKQLAPGTIQKLIAEQPHSWGKVEAAWHLAVGGALARQTTPVRDGDGVVYVRTHDARVSVQLELHRRTIETRLGDILGPQGRTFTIV